MLLFLTFTELSMSYVADECVRTHVQTSTPFPENPLSLCFSNQAPSTVCVCSLVLGKTKVHRINLFLECQYYFIWGDGEPYFFTCRNIFEKNAKFAWILRYNIRIQRIILATHHFKLYLETSTSTLIHSRIKV